MAEDKKLVSMEKCFVCGVTASFLIETNATLFREAVCNNCGASKRNSDIAHALIQTCTKKEDVSLLESLDFLKDLYIYEAGATGKIHELLVTLPNYVCSEFFDGVSSGSTKNNIRCEDLANLTFPDSTFDIVITQDVLEHVSDPEKAFCEINRVLKLGGYHIFTVPLHEGKKALSFRAKISDKKLIHFMPAVYHGDPLREKGSLVYTDFGDDLNNKLAAMGMPTEIKYYSRWYSPEEISFVNDGNYKIYKEAYDARRFETFFKYNSAVLISKKAEISFTGERYIPWMEIGEIHYEHLHRYRFAKEFVRGKKVLDLASGEGYGSNMLSEDAESVMGIDIDDISIRHASSRYIKENLKFIKGSITEIPIEGEKIFDIIVCFEALEHVDEHGELMKEVKRLIRDDGIFIVSTPNKYTYSDQPDYLNPFHLKELYLDEFKDLLTRYFKNVFFYGQKVYPSSNIFALYKASMASRDFIIEKGDKEFHFLPQEKKVAKYLIALASDSNLDPNELIGNSYLVDITETLFRYRDEQIRQKDEQIRQRDEQIKGLHASLVEVRNTIAYKIYSKTIKPLKKRFKR